MTLAMLTAAASRAATDEGSERSRELLDYTCSSAFGSHRLTLFANGTMRLWQGRNGARRMTLAELAADELDSYLERLSQEPYDRSQASPSGGPSGEMVEQCALALTLDGAAPITYRFSRIEGLSLDLSHRLAIADELLAEAKARDQGLDFPPAYVPRAGDVLRHNDGTRFRIERYTADGRGLEIAGIDSPLLLYVAVDAVVGEFSGLLERAAER